MDKNMKYNFDILLERIYDVLESTDLTITRQKLTEIKDSVICVGNGGSSVVSEFASKVFNFKNGVTSECLEPRDLVYKNLKPYSNVFIASYGGLSHGVFLATKNNLNKYVLTHGDIEGVNSIKYSSTIPKERSFISLAATMMPMSILLDYTNNDTYSLINGMFKEIEEFDFDSSHDTFEVMTGYDTSVASRYIESTFTEANLGNVIIHNKYDFCHGRTTLPHHNDNILIYLKTGDTELDSLLLSVSNELYRNVIVLESNYDDIIIDNYNLTLKAMFLSKFLAEKKNIDLSKVDYSPVVKRLYTFKGTV